MERRRRLETLGFGEKDAIFRAVDKAHSAMHSPHVTLIYERFGHGTGKPSEDPPAVKPPTGQAQSPPNRPDA